MSDPTTTPAPGQTPEQKAAAEKAAADAKARADEAKAKAVEGVDARRAAQEKQVKEEEERAAGRKPTPTQREIDLAKVGALDIDDKEDDGSGDEAEAHQRMLSERLPGNNPYQTRNVAPERKSKK